MGVKPRGFPSVRLALLAGCVLIGAQAQAQHYKQTNLVSNDPALAPVTDANLKNPWGLSRSSGSPWWVANNGTGTSTLYNGTTGVASALVVTIPPASGTDPGVPTGTLYNGIATDFLLTPPTNPARFLFVTEDGTISGWNPAVDATHAVVKVTTPGAVYKGAALAYRRGARFLYVTNFAKRRIEVFDSSFNRVHLGDDDHHGGDHHDGYDDHDRDHHDGDRFEDERIPRDYSPFNVQNIGGDLYVTFAKRDPATNDDVAGPGFGYVDVFSPSGRLLRRFQHGPWLNGPWGVALAPGDFGVFSHNLLVGQFGSGEIAAYDAVTGAFLGKVQDASDKPIAIDGLWALSFGSGANAGGPLNSLFFTAGIENEGGGLFGAITAVEQPLGNGQ
jgi:uncharacterized protein (TIGR03118 family)